MGLSSELKFISDQDLVALIVVQDGLVKYFNTAAMKMSGYTKADVDSWKPYQFLDILIHPDDRPMVADQYRKKQAGEKEGLVPSYQFRLITKAGKAIWVQIFSNTGYHDGKLADILILIDVTEKHELEQKLHESESVFRTISEQSSLGILILQHDKIAYANAKFCDIMELTPDKLLGASVSAMMMSGEETLHSDAFATLARHVASPGGTEGNFIINITSKNGKAKSLQLFSKQIILSQHPATLITAFDVTEKAKLESVIVEEEKKFRIITEQSTLGIAIIQDGKIVYMNERCAGSLEKKPADVVGLPFEPFFSMIPDVVRDERVEKYKRWLAGEHIRENQYILPMTLPSGKRITLEIFSKSIEYNDRPAILVTVLDVTARFNAEAELKESEEKFHFIAEKSLIGIIFLQAGKVRYVNDHAASIYGYSTADMLGWNEQHLLMKIHPGDRPPTSAMFLDRLHTKDVQEAAFRIITREGRVKWIQATSGALAYRGENAILLVISDVTGAKESEAKLKESEEKYHQVFEESAAAIILLSMKGVLLDCNTAAEKMFGLGRTRIIGRSIRDFFPQVVIDTVPLASSLRNAAQIRVVEPSEFEFTNMQGSRIWVRAQAARIKYGNTNVIQFIINDITEKKHLERILEEENIKLKHLDNIRKNFIFTATHELKTPLVSLYGASEFLLEVLPPALDEKIKTMINIIHRGAERLKALVDNLLDVSRMDTGNFKLACQNIDLAEIIKQTLANLTYLVSTAGDEIVLHLEQPVIVHADKIRMEQVFTNLLSNAIKNTPKGGRIEICLVKNGDTAIFSIKDNGVGLNVEEMGELFKQFGKLERTDLNVAVNIQGSGLGLYISKNIVEMHGGSIWAESAGRNQGAVFHVTLPVGGVANLGAEGNP